jgi:membrane protein
MLKSFQNSSLFRSTVSTVAPHARNLRDWVGSFFLVKLMIRTFKEMSADDATHMAAGLSYYSLFSIFPLLLFLIAAMSLVLEPEDIRLKLTDVFAGYFPGSGQLIDTNLDAIQRVQGALGVFGLLGLLWSGSAVFGAVSRSVNRAWDVHVDRPFFINKPRQLVMALGVGLLFLVSLGIVAVVRSIDLILPPQAQEFGFMLHWLTPVVLQGSSFLMTMLMFLLMYKFMPNTRTYWEYIWPGAISAAVLFELAKNLFVLYLTRFAGFENTYGGLTPVIVLLFWTYLSGLILIFGAELSSEYGRLRRGIGRGVLLDGGDPPPDPPEGRGDSPPQ